MRRLSVANAHIERGEVADAGSADTPVGQGAARLAGRRQRGHGAQAVDHLMGQSDGLAEGGGQRAGSERFGQGRRQQPGQIGRGRKHALANHSQQPPLDRAPAVPPPIVRRIVAEGFDYLDAPPGVHAGADLPLPFSPPLEKACLPQPDTIAAAIRQLVG